MAPQQTSLVGQAWEQLRGMVLPEVRKKVEELAEAERKTRLGRGGMCEKELRCGAGATDCGSC